MDLHALHDFKALVRNLLAILLVHLLDLPGSLVYERCYNHLSQHSLLVWSGLSLLLKEVAHLIFLPRVIDDVQQNVHQLIQILLYLLQTFGLEHMRPSLLHDLVLYIFRLAQVHNISDKFSNDSHLHEQIAPAAHLCRIM